jgi:predicted aldo/keto reductase-like oxidoreductase
MKYRRFGKLDWKVSALGFGMMRLPTSGNNPGDIDETEAMRMVRHAIDHGINYVDTAWAYHDEKSEPFLGRALKDGYRQKVRVATKLPCWLVKQTQDPDKYLNEQLRRLQTDYIDFYLLHSLDQKSWRKMRDLDVLSWAEGAIADGRIRYLGFSFHDQYEVFQEIVDGYDNWDFCQIQYNYMDIENQAGVKGLQYAAARGLAVVIMEPLLGGKLASPPANVQAIWDAAPHRRTPVEWALQWLWSQPEVSVVLSGMSTMRQVKENIAFADRSGIGTLRLEDLELIDRIRGKYNELCPIPCTNCQYCLPCPSGVNIPRVFEAFNIGVMHDDPSAAREDYKWISEEERADKCVQCQQCEDLCPQHIPISEWMEKVDKVLAQGQSYEECLLS